MNVLPPNRRSILFALAFALLALLFVPLAQAAQPQQLTPEHIVAHAWEQARASGAYAFQTQIAQQTQATASLRSAGRPPRQDYLTLRGTIDQPAARAELLLWRSRSAEPTKDAVEIRVVDGKPEGRVGNGAWKPVELDTTNFAPGGDPLGFLASARDVKTGTVETRSIGDISREYASYTFALDGHAFARYLEQTLVPQLRAQGKLPNWASLDLATQYQNLRGTGTLWIDADGLPARLQLDVQMPELKNADMVRAAITTDFSAFNRQRLALASTRFSENPTGCSATASARCTRLRRRSTMLP